MLSSPLVVGYKGEIGRFILSGLLEFLPRANDILCVDVNNSDADVLERIEKADTIFLCVPLYATAEWLERWKGHLAGKIIAEQCSIKSFLYEDATFDGLQLLSMHLLFRPSATPIADRRALVFSDRLPLETVEAFSQVASQAFQATFEMLEAAGGPAYLLHDRLMARHQALVHRVLVSLSEAIDDPAIQTYVGQRVRELADRIRAGDGSLYRLIQDNPHLPAELDSFQRHLETFTVDW